MPPPPTQLLSSSVMLRRLSLVVLPAVAWACAEPEFDATRRVPERGTLGEEIYGLLARDYERDNPRQAQGFALERDDFIYSVDHLLPPDELEYTQEFLVKLLPLQDDGTVPETTRKLAAAAGRLAEDEAALRSLAAIGQRKGYVDLQHEEALVRRIGRFPRYRELSRALIDLALSHDGRDEVGRPDARESDLLARLQAQLSKRLSEIEISEDAERDIVLLADLLMTEDPRFATGPTPAVEVVARDPRGVAQVKIAAPGAMPAPFVDTSPRDGRADVDALGRFVDEGGRPVELPPFGTEGPRDTAGRALDGSTTIYQYVALEQTLLASLLRTSRDLIDREVPMKALRTFDVVLGERTVEGLYDQDDSPLLDLVHGLGAAADLRELPDLIDLLHILMDQHEATMMWMMLEAQDQFDIADSYPVSLRANHRMLSQTVNWAQKVLAVPGLAEDLIDALQDPAAAGLPQAGITLMSHKKERITPAAVQNGTVFDTLVDPARPDVRDNQSLQQRLFHLIYDTKGVRYTPELIGIPIGFVFEIDDLAEFYMLSVIGQAEIPSLVSTITGLSTRPTPEELAIFINADQAFGNPVGKEGFEVKENDGDTLFAATESGMIDSLRPLIQVFYAHGQLRLLFELFEILHFNWASESSDYQDRAATQPRYSYLTGIARYQPMLIEIFRDTRMYDGMRKMLDETELVRTRGGRAAHPLLLQLARRLLAKDPALRTRNGAREVTIKGERITPLSPFDLIRHALDRLDQRVRRESQTKREWDEIVDVAYDLFLKAERTGPETGQLENREALPTALILLDFLHGRVARQVNTPNFSTWVKEDMLAAATDALTAPELPMMIDLAYELELTPEVEDPLFALRDELLAEGDGFADLLVTVGDGAQAAKDASLAVGLVQYLGKELDPQQLNLWHCLTTAKRSLDLDPDEHLLEVARRGLDPRPGGGLALYGLLEAAQQVQRKDPLATGPLLADDWRKITAKVSTFLLDEEHGLEKFYSLVRGRKGPQEAQP